MTPEQLQVLDLKKSGHSRAEIASIIGISERQVKRRLESAKRWIDADPAARVAATVAGSETIPHSFWVKSDTHSIYYKTPSDDAKQDFLAAIAEAFKDIPALVMPQPSRAGNDAMTVYPLYDMHIGMLAWARETRGQDYDLDLAKQDLINGIETIAMRAPGSDTALVILGGDTLHVNDQFNETPGSKHHMDADGRFEKIVDVAIEAISHAIEYLATKHSKVMVVILRGNHDETSHIVLKAALKQRYRLSAGIEFPVVSGWDKSEIYWFQHGSSLVIAHHGDKMPPQRLAMISADQCPFWSTEACNPDRPLAFHEGAGLPRRYTLHAEGLCPCGRIRGYVRRCQGSVCNDVLPAQGACEYGV
jgi:transposase-like protein